MWAQEGGLWLLARSAVLEGLDRHALFLIAVPFDVHSTVQAWGFWDRGCPAFLTWMGPRHTNFPHGSICAMEPGDGSWGNGGSLVSLLDIYTLWALRQFHLEMLQRWPGSQVARWRYERLHETLPDELCSCGSFNKTYAQCCRPSDLQRNCVANAIKFLAETGGGIRVPPTEVFQFLRRQSSPPPVVQYVN
jgi:hypothetical protein